MLHPPPLERCVAAVDYAFPWDRLLQRFKFHGEVAWASLLARHMLDAPGARDLMASADWWLSVPLSNRRLGERGYNQAWALTRALVKSTGTPADRAHNDWLLKLGDPPLQHRLDKAQRQHNLATAFVTAPQAQTALRGSSVLLIDDIMTTGATLHAAAQALHRAGVASVSAWVLARTPAPSQGD